MTYPELNAKSYRLVASKLFGGWRRARPAVISEQTKTTEPRRSKWIWISFSLVVLFPAITASFYYALFASPQYEAISRFVIRGSTQRMPVQGLSFGSSALAQFVKLNNSQEGAIISRYIRSEGMVEYLSNNLDLLEVYGRSEIDYLSRLRSFRSSENATAYWLKMVSIDVDVLSGIYSLRTRAFSEADALHVMSLALLGSETLVNNMLGDFRNRVLSNSEIELRQSITEAAVARRALGELRGGERLLDAEESARGLLKTESRLRQQKIEIETELTILRNNLTDDSPVIKEASGRLRKIESQIQEVRDELTISSDRRASISNAIGIYERRKFDVQVADSKQDFADRLLNNARRESELRHIYLEVFEAPTASAVNRRGSIGWAIIRIFGALLVLWLIGILLLWRVLEHSD